MRYLRRKEAKLNGASLTLLCPPIMDDASSKLAHLLTLSNKQPTLIEPLRK